MTNRSIDRLAVLSKCLVERLPKIGFSQQDKDKFKFQSTDGVQFSIEHHHDKDISRPLLLVATTSDKKHTICRRIRAYQKISNRRIKHEMMRARRALERMSEGLSPYIGTGIKKYHSEYQEWRKTSRPAKQHPAAVPKTPVKTKAVPATKKTKTAKGSIQRATAAVGKPVLTKPLTTKPPKGAIKSAIAETKPKRQLTIDMGRAAVITPQVPPPAGATRCVCFACGRELGEMSDAMKDIPREQIMCSDCSSSQLPQPAPLPEQEEKTAEVATPDTKA